MDEYRTKAGTVLTEARIRELAAEAERGYDVSRLLLQQAADRLLVSEGDARYIDANVELAERIKGYLHLPPDTSGEHTLTLGRDDLVELLRELHGPSATSRRLAHICYLIEQELGMSAKELGM